MTIPLLVPSKNFDIIYNAAFKNLLISIFHQVLESSCNWKEALTKPFSFLTISNLNNTTSYKLRNFYGLVSQIIVP